MIDFDALTEPTVLRSDASCDERGVVFFNNNMSLASFVRMYFVRNHRADTVRAWHGHRQESKLIFPVSGGVKICAVRIDDLQNDSDRIHYWSFWLSSAEGHCCFIPAGYAHGHMMTHPGGTLFVLSNRTIEQSREDDLRWPVSALASPWVRADA